MSEKESLLRNELTLPKGVFVNIKKKRGFEGFGGVGRRTVSFKPIMGTSASSQECFQEKEEKGDVSISSETKPAVS